MDYFHSLVSELFQQLNIEKPEDRDEYSFELDDESLLHIAFQPNTESVVVFRLIDAFIDNLEPEQYCQLLALNSFSDTFIKSGVFTTENADCAIIWIQSPLKSLDLEELKTFVEQLQVDFPPAIKQGQSDPM
ncbi:CesT family type III secretion system chaperone [Endozoicomonas ascidiicola]|uniref:CesT family type III secretion system chaperone n=1 Tax=Endozoicomonas ascidiicola TaxID=1698521 RepID=UPI00082D9A79|nr:CesT family type III secretion system chaperone [Endozoicomonas ascidiicola]